VYFVGIKNAAERTGSVLTFPKYDNDNTNKNSDKKNDKDSKANNSFDQFSCRLYT